MRRVKAELDSRKLVSTIVHVVRPHYRNLAISVAIVRHATGSSEVLKARSPAGFRNFCTRFTAARTTGAGRLAVRSARLTSTTCARVAGVDFVDQVTVRGRDLDVDLELDFVRIEDDELPFVESVEVIERAHGDFIDGVRCWASTADVWGRPFQVKEAACSRRDWIEPRRGYQGPPRGRIQRRADKVRRVLRKRPTLSSANSPDRGTLHEASRSGLPCPRSASSVISHLFTSRETVISTHFSWIFFGYFSISRMGSTGR